jgi:transcriptional regulator with XRE-family HTH domain
MTVSKINILLAVLDITHQQIAGATGLAQPTVTMTIRGERSSRKTQERIANYIRDQVTADTLFGSESTEALPQTKAVRSKRKRADLSY